MTSVEARTKNLSLTRTQGVMSERRWRALERALAFNRKDRTASVADFLGELEGKRDVTNRRFWIVGIASALAAAAIAIWLGPGRTDPDEVFLDRLLASAGSQTLDEEDQRSIESDFRLGDAHVNYARDSFNDLNAVAGHYDLTYGSPNALAAYRSILELTPSEEAARGVLAVVSAYADGAELFAAGDKPDEALWLACQGYFIHQESSRIIDQIKELTEVDASKEATDLARVCRSATAE